MALERFSSAKYCGWLDPAVRVPPDLLENLSAAESYPGAELLLRCRGRIIVRLPLAVDGRSTSSFLYLFRNRSFARALRPSYAFHIMRIADRVRRAGFETLEVLAALTPRRQLLNWDSFLVAREILQVSELPSAGRHIFQVHAWANLNPLVIGEVARSLAAFHNAGFIHGDLKSRHVLVRNEPEPGRSPVVLVDLEKTRKLNPLAGPARDFYSARDLIQLLASLPSGREAGGECDPRAELLKAYFNHRGLPPRRSRLMGRLVALYGPGGSFQQGKTLLQCVLESRKASRVEPARSGSPLLSPEPIGPVPPPRPGSADTARQSESS